jgi:hypothetical protein
VARDRRKEENEKLAFGLEIVREGRRMADLEGLPTYRRFFVAADSRFAERSAAHAGSAISPSDSER